MDPALPGQEPKMTGPQLHTLEVGSASHEDGRGSCQHSLRSQHSFTSEQSAVGGRELSHRLFRYDHLDRKLKREHITGEFVTVEWLHSLPVDACLESDVSKQIH